MKARSEKTPTGERFKTRSGEFNRPFKELTHLKSLSDEEFEEQWGPTFIELYKVADDFRKKGKHKEALTAFQKSRKVVKEARIRGIEDRIILIRESFLHYMIIQCYTNLQKDPDLVMREFHNFGAVLYEYIQYIFESHKDMQDTMKDLNRIHTYENYIDVELLLDHFKRFFREKSDTLEAEDMENVWICAYLFTRFASSIHDFFLRSTALIDVGTRYHGICKTSSKIAKLAYAEVDPKAIEQDPLKKVIQGLMKWLDGYEIFLKKDIAHILGNEKKEKPGKEDSRSTIEITAMQINAMHVDMEDENERKGYEFSLEVAAQSIFDKMNKEEMDYLDGIQSLKLRAHEAIKYDCIRVAIQIFIYLCRAAIRYEDIEEAEACLAFLKELNGKSDEQLRQEEHIFDRWILVLDSEIKLQKYNSKKGIDRERKLQREQIADQEIELDHMEDLLQMLKLEEIERIFQRYQVDTKTKPPKLSYKPLDAKIFYILGVVSYEKAAIIGEKYKTELDKDEKEAIGKNLLKAFEDAQVYLLEAHAVLDDMQFEGESFKRKIEKKYKELINLNYVIMGTRKRDDHETFEKDPDKDATKDGKSEMAEITRDYQIQKWTNMLFKVITAHADEEDNFSNEKLQMALTEALQQSFPTVTSSLIYDGDPKDFKSLNSVKRFKQGKNRSYFYHTDDGKVTEVLAIDPENERYLILELDMKLTKNGREMVEEIANALQYLLKIRDGKEKLDDPLLTIDQRMELKNEVLDNVYELFLNLMRRHQPTIRHSEGVAEMLTIAAEKINKKHGRKVVDPQMARYAGLLHDIGKLFLNPNLILDIARRLEDFEMKEVRQHVNNGLEFLRVLIGFQHFSELVSLIGAHHVQYGNDKGYPTDAQGDSIKGLPKMISEELKIPEDHEDYMAKELDPAHALLARLLTVIDVMSAVRSWDRFYREGPTPIKDFVDSLISRAGNDYDPEAIILVFELFNEGAFNNALCHTGADREVLEKAQVFDKLYGWGDVAKFINHYQDEFEKIFGVQLDELKGRFMGGIKPNLKMTRETIGREICEVMINSSEDEDAARDRYKRLQGYLMVRFDDWFATIE